MGLYTRLQFSDIRILTTLLFFFLISASEAQQVTGVWKGKIDKKRVEVKIIQNGDSLTGTSYYFEGSHTYRRYSIKGYFDPMNNSVVWWDDQLIEEKGVTLLVKNKSPLLSVADFNCPDGGKMYLDGKSASKEDPTDTKGPVGLTKETDSNFPDEWDYVIDNFTVGASDPYFIDSISLVAFRPDRGPQKPVRQEETPVVKNKRPGMVMIPPVPEPKKEPVIEPQLPAETMVVRKPLTIEEKYTTRRKVFATEIPAEGDVIELRFYDNAEIDGDSISLFLNDKLLFKNIRLSEKAYTIKLPVIELEEKSELTMVAENLGTIPPNTSYMVALVGDKRFEAKLASTEHSSAVIRLKKKP